MRWKVTSPNRKGEVYVVWSNGKRAHDNGFTNYKKALKFVEKLEGLGESPIIEILLMDADGYVTI